MPGNDFDSVMRARFTRANIKRIKIFARRMNDTVLIAFRLVFGVVERRFQYGEWWSGGRNQKWCFCRISPGPGGE